ncbi:MAG TPA: SLC13 family permease [Acidimicrobiales bacterium]|nr:SLC13 family permease [Acidimicrobiales bacterium]
MQRSGIATSIRSWPRPQWLLAGAGAVAALAAVVASAPDARAAAAQVWPAFVLVAGLLLVGLVAHEDGLFEAGGHALARFAPNGWALYAGSALLVLVVTTLLNLDTSVTFLTPVLVYAARRRGEGEAPLLLACLLLSNAGSLLLPGSNLTNVIVLGHLHLSGRSFFEHMAPAGLTAAAVTAVVIAATHRRSLRTTAVVSIEVPRPIIGVGLVAVGAVTVLVIVLRSPALPVFVVGLVAVLLRVRRAAPSAGEAVEVLGVPVLVGLFGLAVTLGALGRGWSGPAALLAHLDSWGTAIVAAILSVLFNNLPAASLLAARPPPHPYGLLVGLNVGPNLFITGSLAWVLWLRAARSAGARVDIRGAVTLGLLSVPMAIAGALLVLGAEGSH